MKKPKNLENAAFTGFLISTDKKIVDDLNGCKNKDQKETETDDECQGAYHAEAFEALNKWFEKQDKSNCFKMF